MEIIMIHQKARTVSSETFAVAARQLGNFVGRRDSAV
jgi:hypothetical protein